MGAGVAHRGSMLSVGQAQAVSVQIGAVGDKMCEEFPNQECGFTLITSGWESFEDSAKMCVMVSKGLWSCFLLLSQYCWTCLYSPAHS